MRTITHAKRPRKARDDRSQAVLGSGPCRPGKAYVNQGPWTLPAGAG